jgi:succinyl-CoA synthetase beta subunit
MRKAGINVQKFEVASTAEEAAQIARDLGAKENVIKVRCRVTSRHVTCGCKCLQVLACVRACVIERVYVGVSACVRMH